MSPIWRDVRSLGEKSRIPRNARSGFQDHRHRPLGHLSARMIIARNPASFAISSRLLVALPGSRIERRVAGLHPQPRRSRHGHRDRIGGQPRRRGRSRRRRRHATVRRMLQLPSRTRGSLSRGSRRSRSSARPAASSRFRRISGPTPRRATSMGTSAARIRRATFPAL